MYDDRGFSEDTVCVVVRETKPMLIQVVRMQCYLSVQLEAYVLLSVDCIAHANTVHASDVRILNYSLEEGAAQLSSCTGENDYLVLAPSGLLGPWRRQ